MIVTQIRFERKLEIKNPLSPAQFFLIAEDFLKWANLRSIVTVGDKVTFKNALFSSNSQGRWWTLIDRGYISYNQETSTIIYSISIIRVFIMASIVSLLGGLVRQSPLIGLIAFMLIYGANRIGITLKQQALFDMIADQIEIAET